MMIPEAVTSKEIMDSRREESLVTWHRLGGETYNRDTVATNAGVVLLKDNMAALVYELCYI